MHIIIAGDGKVGSTLARQLSAEGYDLTLIDSNQQVLDTMIEQYDVMTVNGNCAALNTLRQAGVEQAELLIAATSADEINLLCCTTAHAVNPNLHTIARIRNPDYYEQIYEMREQFALSLMVNPERQAAMEIQRLLEFPGFLRRDSFAKGRVEIVELRVDEDSRLNGAMLSNLESITKCKALVCAVLRDGKTVMPDGQFVLKDGDRIYITAGTSVLATLLKNLGIITRKVKRVMLVGGGRVSFYLAQSLLRTGATVQIIEKNYERCLELSAQLPSASVIHGDASHQTILESQGITSCDAVATLTGIDELNVIMSIYAKHMGVPQVITKLGHEDPMGILDRLSTGSVVSPKELCCNIIVRYVRAIQNQAGAAESVHSIASGHAEAVEFRLDSSARNCGVPLKNLRLKKNVLLVSISRGFRMEIPNGNSKFHVGDTVIVVTNGDTVLLQFNDIFA